MYNSKIIVTVNPADWEGDFRLWESMATGALVFVDPIFVPHSYPLIDGKHVIFFSNSNRQELYEKLDYYLNNPIKAREIAINGYLYCMKYHRTVNMIDYLKLQLRSGADAIQLFDTWLCEMPRQYFVELYVPLLNRIFRELKDEKTKLIYFAKGSSHLLADFKKLECDVLSVDSLMELRDVEKITEGRFSLQGNLDPIILLKADAPTVRFKTRLLVQQARTLNKPAILNLGHGILPKTPVENAKAFVEEAGALWL
jgi:hypothetical protein